MNELYHHGILGMKWGKRKSKTFSKDYTAVKKLRKKNIKNLSNENLKEINNRLNLESSYRQLKNNRSATSRGLNAATKVSAIVGSSMALYKIGSKAYSSGKTITTKVLDRLYLAKLR